MKSNDGSDILQRVGQIYAGLSSYKDAGTVESVIHPGSSEEYRQRMNFCTYFKRPYFFRFEWTERTFEDWPLAHNRIWCDGRAAFKQYDGDEVKQVFMKPGHLDPANDLALAVAGATGVSSCASHNVSALLMHEMGGNTLTNDRTDYQGEVQEADGERCYLLVHNSPSDAKYVWISRSRLIFRKIVEDSIVPSASVDSEFKVHRTTEYSIVEMNIDIEDEVFTEVL